MKSIVGVVYSIFRDESIFFPAKTNLSKILNQVRRSRDYKHHNTYFTFIIVHIV